MSPMKLESLTVGKKLRCEDVTLGACASEEYPKLRFDFQMSGSRCRGGTDSCTGLSSSAVGL